MKYTKFLTLYIALAFVFLSTACHSSKRSPGNNEVPTLHKYIFVSPDGNDNNEGTLDNPLSSFEAAQNLIRSYKKDNPSTPVTAYFRGGKYYRTHALVFKSTDSGSKSGPVKYSAYQDEKPVMLGGKKLELK